MPPVDYVVMGHAAKDILPNGYTIGGTATYSAMTAQRLGLRAAIVTAAEASFESELRTFLPAIEIHNRLSPHTTTFENIYTDLGRIQYLRARADRIETIDVPEEWRSASIIHLGPIAQEFDESLRDLFEGNFVGITPQGWMRQWDAEGRVSLSPWEQAVDLLARVNAVIFSWEDLAGDERLIDLYAHAVPMAVMTLGRRGAVVFEGSNTHYVPSRKSNIVDSTGAGDVFATAFFVCYKESSDPLAAARFASVAASFSVEGQGLAGIPSRDQVQAWLDTHRGFSR